MSIARRFVARIEKVRPEVENHDFRVRLPPPSSTFVRALVVSLAELAFVPPTMKRKTDWTNAGNRTVAPIDSNQRSSNQRIRIVMATRGGSWSR